MSSRESLRVRDSVERLGDRLRAGGLSASDVDDIATALVQLTSHPRWEVRRAVAIALADLRHEYFDVAVAKLSTDDSQWVRQAAEQTRQRRAAGSERNRLDAEHVAVVAEWLAGFERKHGKAARRDASRLLRRSVDVASKEMFHELASPMTALGASLTTLQQSVEAGSFERASLVRQMSRIRGRFRTARRVLETLRTFHRIEALTFRPENLRGMLSQALSDVREHWKDHKPVTTEIVGPADLLIDAHRDRLMQAIRNVLQNSFEALRSIRRARRIELEVVAASGPWVTIRICDNGCGMPPDALRDAFALFATSKPKGLGFGLTLARKIVQEEHRGWITIESTVGEGTTVTIRLPGRQGAAEDAL